MVSYVSPILDWLCGVCSCEKGKATNLNSVVSVSSVGSPVTSGITGMMSTMSVIRNRYDFEFKDKFIERRPSVSHNFSLQPYPTIAIPSLTESGSGLGSEISSLADSVSSKMGISDPRKPQETASAPTSQSVPAAEAPPE